MEARWLCASNQANTMVVNDSRNDQMVKFTVSYLTC